MPDTLRNLRPVVIPVSFLLIGMIWAWHYYSTVKSELSEDPDALALIEPLIWVLVPLTLLTAGHTILLALQNSLSENHGLDDWRRQTYIVAVLVFLISLSFSGFLISGLLFFLILSWVLGMKQLFVLLACTIGLAGVIYFGFFVFLKVDLPLIPG